MNQLTDTTSRQQTALLLHGGFLVIAWMRRSQQENILLTCEVYHPQALQTTKSPNDWPISQPLDQQKSLRAKDCVAETMHYSWHTDVLHVGNLFGMDCAAGLGCGIATDRFGLFSSWWKHHDW